MDVARPVKLYRPSSGTEGDGFFSQWCMKCKNDKPMSEGKDYDACEPGEVCQIIADTLAYGIEDPNYPRQWVYGDDGAPKCTAFVSKDTPDAPPRCQHTIDMFTGTTG